MLLWISKGPQDVVATRETDAKSEINSLSENSEFDVYHMR